MKTVLNFCVTKTGTEAVIITVVEPTSVCNLNVKEYEILLIDSKGRIISVFKEYPGLKPVEGWSLKGTQAEEYIKEMQEYFEKHIGTGSLYNVVKLALKIQKHQGQFHYNNPIWEIIESQNLKGQGKYIWKDFIEAQDKIKSLQQTVDKFRMYGTDNNKQIEGIKAQREKEEKAAEKKRQKQIKDKAAEIKKMAKREGYKYAAIVRIYANKGRKYLGESVEFRTEKPQTRKYYEITENSLPVIAEKLLFS
jgi:hypothetical protein